MLEDDSSQELVEVYRRDLGKEFRLLRHQDDGIERNLLMRIPTALLRKDYGEINQVVDGRFHGEVNQVVGAASTCVMWTN